MGNFGKKVVSASLAVLTSVSMLGGSSFVAVAGAATTAELQAQIAALMAQLNAQTTTCTAPAASLTVGSTGASVTALQDWLRGQGYLAVASTGYFGSLTQAAVAKFQAAAGITPAAGYYGPMTAAAVAARCTSTTTTTTTTTSNSSTLQGSAGSITVDALSDFSAEEVGEGDEDVEVLAFEIEADEDSDVQISSIKVEFVESGSTSSEDLTDYAESVSVWFNGEKVGEDDAEDFNENSDVYTKTISLDDVVIEAGETEELVVAVTALNNLDSGDIDSDAWTADVLNVRFKDGDGVTTTEDTDADALEKTFDFATFATSNDVELQITNGDEDINDAHVINVDASDDTDNVSLLSFNVEAEGDSDLTINDLPVIVTTTEAAGTDFDDPDDVIISLYLYADGQKIGTESLSTGDANGDTETVTFEDLDYTIDAGDEVEFIVKAKLQDTGSALDDGDTVSVDITSTERALIDAEDETGEELATGDMTGTATGGTHAVYDIGFELDLVSVDQDKTFESETSGTGDRGTFVIKYSVTAFDGDIYIDNTCVEDNDGSEVSTATSYSVSNNGSNSTSCTVTSTATTDGGNAFLIEEGETETITLTVQVTATADSSAYVSLEAIGWDDAAGGDDNVFDFDLPGDYKTDPVFLDLF